MTTEVRHRREPGTPCWASLMAHRADRTREFYADLFGWEFAPGPPQLGSYWLAEKDGLRVAGIGEGSAEPHRPVSWTTMLAADDVDVAAERVRECGGTVGIGPLNAGEDGRLAIAVDPSGAVFGIWQGGLFIGADVTGVPGSVGWSELLTRDASVVGKFYEVVFGLTVERVGDEDEGRAVLVTGGNAVAGIRGLGSALPRDRGAHWMTSFAVADVDAAAHLAVRLGGRILTAPHAGPHGPTAALSDPEGSPFSLVGLP